jgi:alkylation response protein AidB-like acyl-CoA dehydrogenase
MTGIAGGAIDDVVALASGKVPTGSSRTLAERPAVQEAVARATAQLEAARAYVRAVSEESWSLAESGVELGPGSRARLRMAATHAAGTSVDVVTAMFRVAGGSAVYRRSSLEGRLRDVNTAAQHMMVAQPTWELAGRMLLGAGGADRL